LPRRLEIFGVLTIFEINPPAPRIFSARPSSAFELKFYWTLRKSLPIAKRTCPAEAFPEEGSSYVRDQHPLDITVHELISAGRQRAVQYLRMSTESQRYSLEISKGELLIMPRSTDTITPMFSTRPGNVLQPA